MGCCPECSNTRTVKTEIIENRARTLELPLLARCALTPNPKGEIPDVLALFSIISVFTVIQPPTLYEIPNWQGGVSIVRVRSLIWRLPTNEKKIWWCRSRAYLVDIHFTPLLPRHLFRVRNSSALCLVSHPLVLEAPLTIR